jgi:3-deoxy-D-manno-octulosonate 8-phosphate phosphatase KdsC-like HAD superfamily phosphatase
MITRSRVCFLAAIAGFVIISFASASTKDEYRAATMNGLRTTISFGRAKSAVKNVLAGSKDGKIAILGRGEIMLISQLLLAGRQAQDAELLDLARDLVLACNKVAVDGYDTPKLTSLEQIGLSLRELALAMPQLKEVKLVTGHDGGSLRMGECP